MTKFVILALPRTGSTMLSKSLNKHSEILCDEEIFHFSFRKNSSRNQFKFFKIKLFSKKINYVLNYPFTFFKIKNFLNTFYTNRRKENYLARGFKLMYYQTLYTPGLLTFLKENNVKVILLLRENIFKNAISDMRARQTGIYHKHQKTSGEKASKVQRFKVSISTLKKTMARIQHQKKQMEKILNDFDHLRLSYEKLTEQWNDSIKKVESFLNVADEPLEAVTSKLSTENLKEVISNYDDVEDWLELHGYAEFLN